MRKTIHKAINHYKIPKVLSDSWMKEVKEAMKHPGFKIKPVDESKRISRASTLKEDANYQLFFCLAESRGA